MAVIDDNWNFRIENMRNDSCKDFESRVKCLCDEVLQLNGFRVQQYDTNNISPSNDEELKILIDNNKQLRNEIEKKHEELSKQKNQYENFKQDQKLLSQEVKDTHEAFLMAKKFYKKYLKMYYTTELKNGDKQTIYIQFFTEAKKESEYYSIRLHRDCKTEHYELFETTPKVPIFEELKKSLQETNDVAGMLCSIRQAFMKIKKSKKL
ncbi:uncharacterized protein LOC126369051 [Pectinophora gossypiella]|uniref:uncharacterized protein LOC126369051 n=1 Tax=Pectinophora gossypiella TaxID=13191 RepID=UPI00214F2735|nr:uncharacterized protein LOC126369051 [Pectinophora gossypiella]